LNGRSNDRKRRLRRGNTKRRRISLRVRRRSERPRTIGTSGRISKKRKIYLKSLNRGRLLLRISTGKFMEILTLRETLFDHLHLL
jgi:hypothetical protein